MPLQSIENITSFEHHDLDFDINSFVRLINHCFIEDTVVTHTFVPGVYISILGECQSQRSSKGENQNYRYNYIIALVDETTLSELTFNKGSIWQSFLIRLPLSVLQNSDILPKPYGSSSADTSNVRFAENGPIPSDILRCCEAAWDCSFKGFERELYIKAKAQEVLALFLHKRHSDNQSLISIRKTQLSNVLSHIQAHLSQDWPLAAVANLAGSNRTYVKQDIKALRGVSFRDWLKQTRLETAREQLAGSEPITQIAHNVGFKSQAHFATLFKSEVGVTPSEYRQSLCMKKMPNRAA